MEFIAILVAGLLGWQNGTFGRRELQVIAVVVAGWTAVTTAAAVPYLSLEAFVADLVYHAVVVTVPYLVGVVARQLSRRLR
jgi:hypothetical protein